MPATQWRERRLQNYADKLRISKRKALDRLMMFYNIDKLRLEFDRICDSEYWSSNEPGISHTLRKQRQKIIYNPPAPEPEPVQLELFS